MISGCGWLEDKIYYDNDKLIIQGENYIENGETLEIPAGTTVEFKTSGELAPLALHFGKHGRLIIRNGGVIIAQGTAENPIYLNDYPISNGICFVNSNTQESVFEYCEFVKGFDGINIESSTVKMEHCKFDFLHSPYDYQDNSPFSYEGAEGDFTFRYNYVEVCCLNVKNKCLIEYNYFNDAGVFFYNDYNIASSDYPIIQYNNIVNNAGPPVKLCFPEGGAVENLTINYNYIANCNGKTGVDTDGSQCENVIHQNPQTSFIAEAGCGW